MPISKKEKTFYRHIVADAWRITWRRKSLWLFGFFAALCWGGGAVNYITGMSGRFSSGTPFVGTSVFIENFWRAIASPTHSVRIGAITGLVICVAVLAALVFASLTSVGAIVNAVAKYKRDEYSTLKKDIIAGGRAFWRIFAITLICRLLAVALVVLVWLAFVGYFYLTWLLWIFYIILFAAACFASLFLWFVSSVAAAAVVIDNLSWPEAIAVSYRLLVKHWLIAIETTVILFAATIFAAAAIVVITTVLSLPFTALLFAASFIDSPVMLIIVMGIGVVAGFAVIACVGSALSVFTQATWTMLYLRLGERGIVSKLHRFLAHLRMRLFSRA